MIFPTNVIIVRIVLEKVIPTEPNPPYNKTRFKHGAKIVESMEIILLKINLSFAMITEEKTLVGKESAVLTVIINTSRRIFSISADVILLLKNTPTCVVTIPPTTNTNTASTE